MYFANTYPYFENQSVRVLVHPSEIGVLHYKPGQRNPADLLQALAHLSELLARQGWYKMLGDRRQLSPLTAGEVAHTATFWNTFLLQHQRPLCVAALVRPEVHAQLVTDRHLLPHPALLPSWFRDFDEPDDAIAWLVQCP